MVQIETPANAIRRLMKLNAMTQACLVRFTETAGYSVTHRSSGDIHDA